MNTINPLMPIDITTFLIDSNNAALINFMKYTALCFPFFIFKIKSPFSKGLIAHKDKKSAQVDVPEINSFSKILIFEP